MSAQEWARDFVKVQLDMPPITKDSKANIPTKGGGSYSYSYADLGAIVDKAVPTLNAHGFSIAQDTVTDGNQIGVNTRIYHKSGHVEIFGPLLLPGGGDARSAGSAVTYARRYALTAALGIAVEDDDDGGRATAGAQRERERTEDVKQPEKPKRRSSWAVFQSELLDEYDGDKEQARSEWERCKAALDLLETDDGDLKAADVKAMRAEHVDGSDAELNDAI